MTLTSEEIKKRADEHVMKTYGRYDLALVKGEGCRLWDPEGNEYLDFVAGLAVSSLGHAHPAVAKAVAEQAARLIHVSNLYYTEPMARLAEMLADHSFADRVFFANSGAEANEAAIKLARKYSFDKYGPGRYTVVTMDKSFHGRTMATLSATAQEKIHKGFEPLMAGFRYVPFGDAGALERAVTDDVCAVMIEPIQGEGGVNDAPDGYLQAAADLCRLKDVLLIFDEVQVGLGRTGRLFAYEHFGVVPDIMTLAKALAGGLPMGAALARNQVAEAFTPGAHATTFGGGPVIAAAGLAVMETLTSPGFLERVAEVGDYFRARLADLVEARTYAVRVKGRGLILGLELAFPGGEVVKDLMKKGFLINCAQENVLRFLPPLVVTEAEIDRLMPALIEVLEARAGEYKGTTT